MRPDGTVAALCGARFASRPTLRIAGPPGDQKLITGPLAQPTGPAADLPSLSARCPDEFALDASVAQNRFSRARCNPRLRIFVLMDGRPDRVGLGGVRRGLSVASRLNPLLRTQRRLRSRLRTDIIR